MSLAHAFHTPAPENISSVDPIRTDPQSAQESASCSSQRYEASQPGYESLSGCEAESGGERAFSFGWSFDEEPLNPYAKSCADFNFDLNYGFDQSSRPSFSFWDRPCATPYSHDTPTGAHPSLEASSMSEILSPSPSSPYTSNPSPSNNFKAQNSLQLVVFQSRESTGTLISCLARAVPDDFFAVLR